MGLSDAQIRDLVRSTSVGAIAYQASVLKRELHKINDQEFPAEACEIRDVLICWPEFILTQLWKIQLANPYGATGAMAVRVRGLGEVIHAVYSYIRYLTASAPRQAPPAVQAALNQLIDLYFPKANGRPVCVIRPQWEYNLKYVALSLRLRNLIAPAVLDPDMELTATNSREIPAALWSWRRGTLSVDDQGKIPVEPPEQLAILSFAGLDTNDCLTYPILAHELGHFVDYSFEPRLSSNPAINQLTEVPFSAVESVLTTMAPALVPQANEYWSDVVSRTSVCVRELLADLLGLRMMGFGFLAAQTEFLKTIAPWPDGLVNSSGYPGTQFRAWSLLRHLNRIDFAGNIRLFLANHSSPAGVDLSLLTRYLDEWESRAKYGPDLDTKPTVPDPATATDVGEALDRLVAAAVLKGLDAIVDKAREAIPDTTCANLTESFFERVERLARDLPPTPNPERTKCFAEILSAGWAYQLVHGEEREHREGTIDRQFREYEKTCRLLMKAIELMPQSEGSTPNIPTTTSKEEGAVLSHDHIAARIQLPVSDPLHLGIVPAHLKAVEAASLDVHLGHWFIALRRTRLRSVQLGDTTDEELLRQIGRDETFIPDGKRYLIHPGDLILGATREFVALPADLMAYVEGKSKLGRLGLIVATASTVAPGFHGVVVLELANAGTVPLELTPGMPIAQLVFQKMSQVLPDTSLYRGKFYCQIKP